MRDSGRAAVTGGPAGYRPPQQLPILDGVRGLAILMVLVAHFHGEALAKAHFPLLGPIATKIALSGLAGVDLFFVLSGFLITRILLESRDQAGYFPKFYARRFLRIFPLYYSSLALSFVLLPRLFAFDNAARGLQENQWWLWAYLGNFPGAPGWDGSETIKLGHFWSLAVEEHFYVVWPAVVLLVRPLGRLRSVCLAWAAASYALGFMSALNSPVIPPLFGWSTLTRSGTLALGCYCAVAVRQPGGLARLSEAARRLLPVLGAAWLVVAFVPRRLNENLVVSLKHPLSGVLFSAILVAAVFSAGGGRARRLLESRFMRETGKISYGLYVYHGLFRPVFERLFPRAELVLVTGSPLAGIAAYFVLAIGASYALALLSWHLLEKPFLQLKRFFDYRWSSDASRQRAVDTAVAPNSS